ncbi:hypothetical protein [Edwardsiella piscicida]|uniref:hypothetical protein n=1 Tax=Edwardsiella piscicida TaxID=1263550 RepID=UPI00370D43E8
MFLIFHQGHVNYLLACGKLCDFLIVGVDSNYRVKQLKGDFRPIDDIHTRLSSVAMYCDYSFEKKSPSKTYIEKYHPNILFRSTENRKKNHEKHDNVIYIPYTLGISTSILISKLNYRNKD